MAEIKERKDLDREDKWDLSALFVSDSAWEEGYAELEKRIPEIAPWKGHLGDSSDKLADALEFFDELELLDEKLGYYAMLRISENEGDEDSNRLQARYRSLGTRLQTEMSFLTPELQSIPGENWKTWLEQPRLQTYRITLNKILRFKPHILSEVEERLLAMQGEVAGTPQKAFSALSNVDMEFGSVDTDEGSVPLTNTTFASLLKNTDRSVREKAFTQYYRVWAGHKNTVSSLYQGSIKQDIYNARVHHFSSAREASLFGNDVPPAVYDNLVSAVEKHLPALHDYYELRRQLLGVDQLMHYDVYAPLITDFEKKIPYAEAVELVDQAVKPLGDDYRATLKKGLLGTWVDRYENKGKRSGAFSAGSYAGEPYILLNYREDDLRWLFTLIHEAGHSMHSWYSVRNNPFTHYNYTIFEAEVASTFNEQLLADYLLKRAESPEERAFLLSKQIDDIIATIYRQTMFAAYEHRLHSMAEAGEALTVGVMRSEYRSLLEKYFGPKVGLLENSDLEGLRIPHFYRAFYVYKYATGLSAAIALSEKVLGGGDQEREDYLNFLKSGGSKFPLESLKLAGVDMSSSEPVAAALEKFARLVQEFKELKA